MTIFKLPDLGEGLPDAEISEWHVKIGDHIVLDQSLVSMETAKAVVEVPSPFTGVIKKLYGNVGDIIKTGEPLVELESDESTLSTKASVNASHKLEGDAGTVAGRLPVGNTVLTESATGISVGIRTAAGLSVKATPAVRALAQKLSIDLASLTPTGPHNTITKQDVEEAAKHLQTGHVMPVKAGIQTAATLEAGAGFEPLKGVRRTMAQAMIHAHSEVVPVTIVEDAILSQWQSNQQNTQQNTQHEKPDITVRLIQAIIEAIKIEPALNVIFDGKSLSRKLMQAVHLGIAMDAPEGLFVPVIHNAETLDAPTLRQTIDRLKQEVGERTIKPEDLRGATITISNFGKFAGRYANPIVVPPMVAILGVGRLREEVIPVKGEVKICPVLPLALTFDHRAVTGGEATRFLGTVIKDLEKLQ